MAQDPSADYSEELVFRRGKLRKRDDPAIELFREGLATLRDAGEAEVGRLRRILFELGRLYDPVRNGPILDAATRRTVLESAETGDPEAARRALEAALQRYVRLDRRDPPGTAGPGDRPVRDSPSSRRPEFREEP